MPTLEPATTSHATTEISAYAKKCLDALLGLEPNRTDEDRAVILKAVRSVAEKFSAEGKDAAEQHFAGFHKAFTAVAKANQVMDEITGKPAAVKTEGLATLGAFLSGLDAGKVAAIGSIAERLPMGESLGKALMTLTSLEVTLKEFSGGKPVVFKALGDLVTGTHEKLAKQGIDTSFGGLKDAAQRLLKQTTANLMETHSGAGTTEHKPAARKQQAFRE